MQFLSLLLPRYPTKFRNDKFRASPSSPKNFYPSLSFSSAAAAAAAEAMSNPTQTLPPGFRFHPTDEELIIHYLRNRAASSPCPVSIIAEVDIYKFDPWELPSKALFGDREWYFFSPRDRKYPNGVRPNRAAASGYWKATGTDKPISSGKENIGVKKALVFYKGRPPKGIKTNWIMHEYRLAEARTTNTYRPIKLRDTSMRLDDWVLCRIYKKSNHQVSASADPPMAEREQEDCAVEDTYIASLPNIQQQEQTTFKLQKSCSISDFLEDYTALSRLFDNLPEMPGQESGSAMNNLTAKQPLIMNQKNSGGEINNDNGYLGQQMSQAGPSANYLKRQRPVVAEEETHGLLHPAKKRSNEACSFTNMGSTFDGAQYSMINQSLLNQQLLLNAHLGLQ